MEQGLGLTAGGEDGKARQSETETEREEERDRLKETKESQREKEAGIVRQKLTEKETKAESRVVSK